MLERPGSLGKMDCWLGKSRGKNRSYSAHWRLTTVQRGFFPFHPQLLRWDNPGDTINIDCYAFENAVSESTFV